MRFHLHFPPAKAHSLSLKPESLLHRGVTSQLDLPACPEYALPRQAEAALQDAHYHPCGSRQSCGPCDTTVGRHFPARNCSNRPLNLQDRASAGLFAFALLLHRAIQPRQMHHSDTTETISHNKIP